MKSILAALSLLATAQAANVTPVRVPNGCASLPMRQQTGISTYFAGPWSVRVDQCVKTTATDNACTIEGFPNVARDTILDGQTEGKYGFVGHLDSMHLNRKLRKANKRFSGQHRQSTI